MKRITDNRILALRTKQLPKATSEIWHVTIKEGVTGEDLQKAQASIAEINDYLKHFVANQSGCVNCGAKQGVSGIEDFIAGAVEGKPARFEWAIQHGEGFCSACGWPGRAMHYINDDLKIKNYILQYHPDSVLLKSERKPEVAPA